MARQADLIPIKVLNTKINIIGAGAIGSFTTLALAKMGFSNLEIWDSDTVSVENMNSQFYRFSDIDKPKVKALKDLVKDFTGVNIKTNFCFYESGILDGIIVTAVDSMEARKLIWEQQKNKAINSIALIDPRMGAEVAALYVYNPMDITSSVYEESLYSDEDALEERCTAKATIYCATMLSGLVAKVIKQICTSEHRIHWHLCNWSIKDDDFVVSGFPDHYSADSRPVDYPDVPTEAPARVQHQMPQPVELRASVGATAGPDFQSMREYATRQEAENRRYVVPATSSHTFNIPPVGEAPNGFGSDQAVGLSEAERREAEAQTIAAAREYYARERNAILSPSGGSSPRRATDSDIWGVDRNARSAVSGSGNQTTGQSEQVHGAVGSPGDGS